MKKRRNGILGTVLFHGAIIMIGIIFGFSTPLPLPEEEGILVNFGTEPTGSGETEVASERTEEQDVLPQQQTPPPAENAREEAITQDFEEAPSVDAAPAEKQPEKKVEEQVTEEQTKPDEEKTVEPVEDPRKVNEKALYRRRNDQTDTDQGEGETEGKTDQGNPTGVPGAEDHTNIPSTGSGGVTWSLEGRNPVSLPKPEYRYQVEGTVVVRIKVDRTGKVVSAEAGIRGSNTTDKRLLEAARKAALKARFNARTDAAFQQQGTLTYRFILQ